MIVKKCKPELITWDEFIIMAFKRAWVIYKLRLKHKDPLEFGECVRQSFKILNIVYNYN